MTEPSKRICRHERGSWWVALFTFLGTFVVGWMLDIGPTEARASVYECPGEEWDLQLRTVEREGNDVVGLERFVWPENPVVGRDGEGSFFLKSCTTTPCNFYLGLH